jgi:hypothetical protein
VVKRPSLSGFSVMEMVDAYSNQPDVEKMNGKYFYVHLIRKVQLFPLQPGTYTLEPAEVESVIHFRRTGDRQNIIRSLRDIFRRDKKTDPELEKMITLETPPVTVEVKPLPVKAQPEEFSGAVGNFSVHWQARGNEWRQHEPSSLRLVINGFGNLPLLTAPEIQWPAGTQTGDPQVTENVNKYVFPLSGSKTFEYTLANRDTGKFSIPPIFLHYFDPVSATYKTAQTAPFTFTVLPERPGEKKEKIVASNSEGIPVHWYYFGIVAFGIIAWVVFQLIRSEHGDPDVKVKNKKVIHPEPVAKERPVDTKLAHVKNALNNTDDKTFYQVLQQTIYEVVGERYHIPPSALTKRSIIHFLEHDKLPDSTVAALRELLDESEWALYTPDENRHGMEQAYKKLESALITL